MREEMKLVLMTTNPDLMTVTEVADYLRVRERTIYELVRTQRIPSCKLSGKLLFPKRLVELWVAQSADYPQAQTHHHRSLPAAMTRSSSGRHANRSVGSRFLLMAAPAVSTASWLAMPLPADYI
jgi:excisionase family DNA binding protein